MNYTYLLIIFLGLCQKANCQFRTDTTYYTSGGIQFISNYKNGVINGSFKSYNENGILESISNYVNGKLNGAQKKFYENGALESIYNCVNEKPGKKM